MDFDFLRIDEEILFWWWHEVSSLLALLV